MDGNTLMKQFLSRNRAVVMYGIFGVCTTLVNIVSYWLCAHVFGLSVSVSTAAAWFVSVLFAYLTNRRWVFESERTETKEVLQEMVSFFASRLSTGFLYWLIMFSAVTKLGFADMPVKIFSNVLVIILNYILGKFVVFSKRGS